MNGIVDAEDTLEEWSNSCTRQLRFARCSRVVTQRHHTETCTLQGLEAVTYVRVGRQGQRYLLELSQLCGIHDTPVNIRKHLQRRRAHPAHVDIGAGKRKRLRVQHDLIEPGAQHGGIAEDIFKNRAQCSQIEDRLGNVEYKNGTFH